MADVRPSIAPSIAAAFTWQRLGNQLTVFATLYSVWRRFGIYHYINIDKVRRLNEVFDLPQVKYACINDWPYFVWESSKLKSHIIVFIYSRY